MQVVDILNIMTPEIYQRLVSAVELGKWPDGTPLTQAQKEYSLQAVMLWQAQHNHTPDHMTVNTDGQLVRKNKQQFKQQFADPKKIPINYQE